MEKILFIFIFVCFGLFRTYGQGVDCTHPEHSEFYTKDLYTFATVDNVTFAEAENWVGEMEVLKAKTSYPGVFNAANPLKRPTICLFHGGGFRGQDTKNSPLMLLLQDYFYKKGFLVVTPDYRQGWEGSDGFCGTGTIEAFEDAQYRAFQDSRALVRFLKAKANTLGVDTNNIFLFGSSAGGINIINFLANEHTLSTPDRVQRLGSLDNYGNSYRYSTQVKGMITAVASTVDLSNIQRNIPLMMIHGTCDNAVPFGEGKLVDCPNLSYMYGSYWINQKMDALGFDCELHAFCGFGHDIGSQNDDPNGNKPSFNYLTAAASDFIFKRLCGDTEQLNDKIANDLLSSSPSDSCTNFEFYELCTRNQPVSEFKIGIFPNYVSSSDRTYIKVISDLSYELRAEIYDFYGKKRWEKTFLVEPGYNAFQENFDFLQAGPHVVVFYKNGVKVSAQKFLVRSPLVKY
ncbi:MAG: carboxylesterase family protein [Chitinophagales bacterium]|nr:carboxylesterase family protein [Chitinophagales bacterium]